MNRKKFTDAALAELKPRDALYEVYDTQQPGLAVRVSPAGRRTFVLVARFPGGTGTRRALGEYVAMGKSERDAARLHYEALHDQGREPTFDAHLLKKYGATTINAAREKARRWQELIRQGRDPAMVEARERQETVRQQANTFARVAEDWFAQKLSKERRGKEVERDVRSVFVKPWGSTPIVEITDLDVVKVINAKKKDAPVQARNLLAHAKRLFSWAIDQRIYGLKASPCAGLKPTRIIGEKNSRDRTLSNDELRALWHAAGRIGYACGPIYKLLMLTGLRRNEVVDCSWSEFDPVVTRAIHERKDGTAIDWTKFDPKHLIWTIPGERMKAKNGQARAHIVPLTLDMLEIIERLPRFKAGKFLFSTTAGKSAVWLGDKVKSKIDRMMIDELRKMASERGEDPAEINLDHWVNHDVRRSVRSRLSGLKVPEEVREAVMAHVRPGVKAVYDRYSYVDEKRAALAEWGATLRAIVEPSPLPDNVISLREIARS